MPLLAGIGRGALRMSKYLSKSARKRIPLTSKHGDKNYYKGKGSRKEGSINSKGRFIVDPAKRLEIMAPDLTGFKLKPYVAQTVRVAKTELARLPAREERGDEAPAVLR